MPSDVTTPAIHARGLARSFGSTPAVTSLDMDVAGGEMFGLVGPDGAGKSTAIRLLCGILKPSAGEGRVLGLDVRSEAERIKARIGYLSQKFTLYGDLTVDENIEFFAELHGVAAFRKRRDELLEFTRLTPFRRRLADALSGGMKKKLALACTLIHTPELILLDEPTTGVDPISRNEFWTILGAIQEQGVAIVMTTPYLDEAERCHRIGLMHAGRLLMTGTPEAVKAALPGAMFQLECPNPPAAHRLLRTRWSFTRLVLRGDVLLFWAPQGEAEAAEAAEWLNRQGLGPATSSVTAPSLEDAFVALLGNRETHGGKQ